MDPIIGADELAGDKSKASFPKPQKRPEISPESQIHVFDTGAQGVVGKKRLSKINLNVDGTKHKIVAADEWIGDKSQATHQKKKQRTETVYEAEKIVFSSNAQDVSGKNVLSIMDPEADGTDRKTAKADEWKVIRADEWAGDKSQASPPKSQKTPETFPESKIHKYDTGTQDVAGKKFLSKIYLKFIKDEGSEAVRNVRNIYENMKNRDLLAIVKYIQTIDQAWDSWENIKLTSVVKSDGWVNKCKKIFGFSSENTSRDQNTFHGELSVLMTKIGKIVTTKIEYVCMKLLSLDNQVEHNFMCFLQFLTEAEILLFLEFMKLSQESSLRYLPIEKGSQSLFKKSKELLFKYFELHDQYFNKILGNYQIETLEKFLTSVQKGTNVMKYIKDFASKFSIPLQVQEYILQSKDYKEMMKHVSQFVWKIEDSIYKTSFLLNNRCTNANREVLSKYYETLKKEYIAISDARCLVNHLVPFGIVPSSVLANSLQHIKKETEELKKLSIDLMKSFPLVQENHTKIYTLYNNLIFIEKHFKDVAPSVANLASESRHDMEALCHSCLHDMLPQNNEVQSIPNLVEILILLKKSSMEILCYRNIINTFIDKILTENAKLSKDSGRFIMDVEMELQQLDDDKKIVACQIISEHKRFQGAMNAIFNCATARHGLEYVLSEIDNLTQDMKDTLRTMYGQFVKEYEEAVIKGLHCHLGKNFTMKEHFEDLVEISIEVANDKRINYCEQLASTTANIFAYWSLKSASSDLLSQPNDKKLSEYLMKPHAAQVIAIWVLLNFQEKGCQSLKNHLVEILTGEGKSIVIGVSAIVLVLMGYEVGCMCYSEYLSDRDHNSFKSMFVDFGVDQYIYYGRVQDFTYKLLHEDGTNLGDLVQKAISKECYTSQTNIVEGERNKPNRLKVLIIDEVDVFFQDKFYGNYLSYTTSISDNPVKKLMSYIWKNKHHLDKDKLYQSTEVQACLNSFSNDCKNMILDQVNKMLESAKSLDTHEYLVSKNEIQYKYLDGLHPWNYDYYTSCAYMKEFENGKITKSSMLNQLNFNICYFNISYAEIPTTFDMVLGVTGTLKGINNQEKQILKDCYDIKNMTYMPSVYGSNKLQFSCDSPKDVILCDSKSDHFLEICNEIDYRIKPSIHGGKERAVMVFFESSEILLEFSESEYVRNLKRTIKIITEMVHPEEKEGAFLQATRSGSVTLMIREYGRGTDFKCYDSRMLECGGIHVIQSFFSAEISEEIQLKGRAARQGKSGSYSMVLNVESLKCLLEIKNNDISCMKNTSRLWSILDKKRSDIYRGKISDREKKVKEAEEKHYESFFFKEALLKNDRKKILEYLFKYNMSSYDKTTSYYAVRSAKKAFLKKRIQKLEEHAQQDRKKREHAQITKANGFLLLKNNIDSDNHYDLLGVDKNASKKEIHKAYLKLSRLYHPDKCKMEHAGEIFNKLNEAKLILCCQVKRAIYDNKLSKNSI